MKIRFTNNIEHLLGSSIAIKSKGGAHRLAQGASEEEVKTIEMPRRSRDPAPGELTTFYNRFTRAPFGSVNHFKYLYLLQMKLRGKKAELTDEERESEDDELTEGYAEASETFGTLGTHVCFERCDPDRRFRRRNDRRLSYFVVRYNP